MRPSVALVLSSALATCPVSTRSALVNANFATLKVERIRSSYERVIAVYKLVSRKTADADTAFPQLARSASIAKTRLPRLDYNVIIAPSLLNKWYSQVRDRDSLNAWCGYDVSRSRSSFQSIIFRRAAQSSLRARKEELVYRIQERLVLGGYPVFWTLTVDPEHEHIIAPRRDEFRFWLRKVRRRFGNFDYCCIVERGAEGRLHYHCLFVFDDLSSCTCPNHMTPNGSREEIPEMRGFWPFGLSNPVAVRYSPADVYGLLGWRWPKGRKTGSPVAVALYMAKYVTKPTDEVNGCRSKMTRGFGLHRLNLMTEMEALSILLGDPQPFLNRVKLTSEPPLSIMKRCAARKLFAQEPRLPLPGMRAGSVVLAAKTLAMAKSTPMNAGDSANLGDGFKGCLNQYRTPTQGLHIGAIM